jgi:hypothetical protein
MSKNKYIPCPYCGEIIKWRGKCEPKHCGKERCQNKFMEEELEKRCSSA